MEEQPPVRHAPKWPWIAAVVFLVLVAVVGALLSQNRRAETVVDINATTTSSVLVPTTASTVVTSTTSAPAVNGAIAATAVPYSTACTEQELLDTIKMSGYVATAMFDSVRIERSKCADGYAYARLQSEVGPADAYLKVQGDRWIVMVLGTSIDTSKLDIPPGTLKTLRT